MRARRLLVMAFLAYVALDLGCPLIPGAFSFESSVDAASAYRVRPPALSVASPPSILLDRSHGVTEVQGAATHVVSLPVAWRPHAIRDHVTAPDPPHSVDDD